MKNNISLLALLVLLVPRISSAEPPVESKPISSVDVKKYVGYFGYFLDALSFARIYSKFWLPEFDIPKLDEVRTFYSAVSGGVSFALGDKKAPEPTLVKTPIEKLSEIGLQAVKVGSLVVGYAFPSVFATKVLSGAIISSAYLPSVREIGSVVRPGLFGRPSLPGPNESYELGEFDNDKIQNTYLACSYVNPESPKDNFKIWAEKRLLSQDENLLKALEFYKDTVYLRGRWMLSDKGYAFGTLLDPLLLESACIVAVAERAHELGISPGKSSRIGLSTGDNRFSNSYPLRFYFVVLLKAPNWSKYRPIIIRKAVLLTGSAE